MRLSTVDSFFVPYKSMTWGVDIQDFLRHPDWFRLGRFSDWALARKAFVLSSGFSSSSGEGAFCFPWMRGHPVPS
jgi:hypothetical protein